jgi:hypothetical protein
MTGGYLSSGFVLGQDLKPVPLMAAANSPSANGGATWLAMIFSFLPGVFRMLGYSAGNTEPTNQRAVLALKNKQIPRTTTGNLHQFNCTEYSRNAISLTAPQSYQPRSGDQEPETL